MLTRVLFWVVGLVFLAATIWRILNASGSVGSIVATVALGLLTLATLGAAVIAARFDATVDAGSDTLVVTNLRTQRMPLDPPTVVTIYRQQRVTGGHRASSTWKAVFERSGDSKIVVAEPYEHDFPEFVASLAPVLARHPELAANAETRGYIEDPASMQTAEHRYGKPKPDPS